MARSDFVIPNDDQVSADDIQPEADLSQTDLSRAKLNGANLSGADLSKASLINASLSGADLSNADLRGANFSAADLEGADLGGANARRTNFSEANLEDCTLIGADLLRAECYSTDFAGSDLSNANLVGAVLINALLPEANLSNADVAEITLRGAKLSRGTKIDNPENQIAVNQESETDLSTTQKYGIIARTNHELKNAYSTNGLVARARDARYRERKARRQEAFADGWWRGYAAWLGSILANLFTGYGVQLRWIVGMMFALFLLSAGVYNYQGMGFHDSLYYSVVTFTTSPPSPPETELSRLVAGIETFAGTAAIVFLGYVLGTRERV